MANAVIAFLEPSSDTWCPFADSLLIVRKCQRASLFVHCPVVLIHSSLASTCCCACSLVEQCALLETQLLLYSRSLLEQCSLLEHQHHPSQAQATVLSESATGHVFLFADNVSLYVILYADYVVDTI